MVCVKFSLTHWGRMTHICVSKLTIIGSDNSLLPSRRQAIIRTSAGILLIGPLGTIFSEILIKILTYLFKKMRLKVSSAKWQPRCLGLNVLNECHRTSQIVTLFQVMAWCCQVTHTWTITDKTVCHMEFLGHNESICEGWNFENAML